MEKSSETVVESVTATSQSESETQDWRARFFEMDLLSPIYVFFFILLFKDGVDGIDLHDAIIRYVASYNVSL